MKEPGEYVILALDVARQTDAERLLEAVQPYIGAVKVGKRLLARLGIPGAVDLVRGYNLPVMLDNKEIDIPDTLRDAAREYKAYHLFGVTAMASAGDVAIRAMVDELTPEQVICVTVPTSMDELACRRLFARAIEEQVRVLAREAVKGGAAALVCAPKEVKMLRRERDLAHLTLITPNIRYADDDIGSQNASRAMNPCDAVVAGVDYMVIGTAIRKAKDPAEAAKRILGDIERGMREIRA